MRYVSSSTSDRNRVVSADPSRTIFDLTDRSLAALLTVSIHINVSIVFN